MQCQDYQYIKVYMNNILLNVKTCIDSYVGPKYISNRYVIKFNCGTATKVSIYEVNTSILK